MRKPWSLREATTTVQSHMASKYPGWELHRLAPQATPLPYQILARFCADLCPCLQLLWQTKNSGRRASIQLKAQCILPEVVPCLPERMALITKKRGWNSLTLNSPHPGGSQPPPPAHLSALPHDALHRAPLVNHTPGQRQHRLLQWKAFPLHKSTAKTCTQPRSCAVENHP